MTVKTFSDLFQNRSLFTKIGCIGLDFALEKINLVQIGQLQSGGLGLHSFCSLAYGTPRDELLRSPKQLRLHLRNAFSGTRLNGKKIVSSIPSNHVKIISVNYVNSKQKDKNDAAVIEAIQHRIDDDVSNYVIDYLPVRAKDIDKEQLAIVALVKNEIVNNFLENLRFAGLQTEALEIRPTAINRYVYSRFADSNYQNILTVNLGEEVSFLTMTSGRRLLFDQQVDFGARKLIELIGNVLEMSCDSVFQMVDKYGLYTPAVEKLPQLISTDNYSKTLQEICKPELDKLVEEINRALLFSAAENHGQSINKIFLFGSMAYWNGLDQYIERRLKIETETVRNPLNIFDDPYDILLNNQFANTPELTIALGHALRGLV